MRYSAKILDIVQIVGRGTILVCDVPKELIVDGPDLTLLTKMKVGDPITINDKDYTIKGIERHLYSTLTGFLIGNYESKIPNLINQTILFKEYE